MQSLARKRIVVTGGSGFLGSHVIELLTARGCRNLFVPRSSVYDLRRQEAIARLYRDTRPDVVIHLAASVGGIGANRENPGLFFYDNLMMGVELLEQARLNGVSKFVAVGTVCAYPNSPQSHLKKLISGQDTLRRQMPPMASLRRCC